MHEMFSEVQKTVWLISDVCFNIPFL